MIQMPLCLWFIGKYNKWDKVDPAELFSQAPTEKKEANPKLNMVKFLQVCGAGGHSSQGGSLPLPVPNKMVFDQPWAGLRACSVSNPR